MTKYLKQLVILALAFALFHSCNERISFDEAQPQQLKALSQIPEKYHGTYFDHDDSTFIIISEQLVIEKEVVQVAEWLPEVMPDIQSEDFVDIISQSDSELVISLWGDEPTRFKIQNDSVFGTLHIPDTLFALDAGDIIKRNDDHVYLNVLNGNGDYYLRKVCLQDDLLTIYKLSGLEEVINMKHLDRPDTSSVKGLRPSRKQFKKLDKEAFKMDRELRKIE